MIACHIFALHYTLPGNSVSDSSLQFVMLSGYEHDWTAEHQRVPALLECLMTSPGLSVTGERRRYPGWRPLLEQYRERQSQIL